MDDENSLIAQRREKLEALKARGANPFGRAYETSGTIAEVREKFSDGATLRAAGRITAHRDMGKSHFVDLRDSTGRIQFYIHAKEVGEEVLELFKLVDLGDFIGAEGTCFLTKTGEPTLKVQTLEILGKSLRPLPEKWHGLQDVEARYRQRYLDLLTNERSRAVFEKRIAIVREIRNFMEARGFLEVETPMLQAVAGGAAAEPFRTHHKALGLELYLRIAPELYLKRLLVGGFNKVFELNRNFRNEGISRKHNPEFTMLEGYWAYADFEKIADLVEEMICHLAVTISETGSRNGTSGTSDIDGTAARVAESKAGAERIKTKSEEIKIEHRDAEGTVTRTINLTRPWRRARYRDLIREIDPEWFNYTSEKRRERCAELGVEINPRMADYEVTQQVFEKLVEEKTFDPLFVTHCPKELVPLAKQNAEDDSLVDVYELIINGQEISPGYSELNDPTTQRQRLLEQAGEETQKIDEEFLLALEHGMPPAGGFGLGIDRLTMLLTGAESIRDVHSLSVAETEKPLKAPPMAGRVKASLREIRFFAKPDDFRKWLKAHHGDASAQWVGFYKKDSGRPSITWPESVDEALCFGWIDGIRKTIDAESYKIRFTPRKATSNWSAVNIARVKELTKRGRMRPAGLKAFALRKEEKSGIYAYENRKLAVLGAADEKRFHSRRKAWDFFQNQPPGYRKLMAWWVISAKREETKEKRLEKLIAESEAGRRLL